MICDYCDERDAEISIPGETGTCNLCNACLKQIFEKVMTTPDPDGLAGETTLQ